MTRFPQYALSVGLSTFGLSVGIVLGLCVGPAAASPGVQSSYPAANAVLSAPPSRVVLQPTAPINPKQTRTTVYNADHATVARGGLATAVPKLPGGVYTVVWSLAATGGKPATGSYAFAVQSGGASPGLVAQAPPTSMLTPVSSAIPKWLAFAFLMTFIGGLALRVLVIRPALNRLPDDDREPLGRATDRLLLLVAGGAILCFIPATLTQMVDESAAKGSTLGFWALARPTALSSYLWNTPDGNLWLIRLALTLLGAVVVIGAAIWAGAGGWSGDSRRVSQVVAVGLAAGTGELIGRVIPTKPPPSWPRQIFTNLLDWGHMFTASIWIGGLVGLAVLGATLRRQPATQPTGAAQASAFWPVVLRRFSIVATVCVGAMILTGLWTYWIHVGPPRLLFHTLYGETLLVKIGLVILLVSLGAVNQLILLPRLAAVRETGDGPAVSSMVRRLRRVVAAEAVVGLLILLVVPFLSGSARNQAFQRNAANLTQTANVGGRAVSIRPSGAQPGVTDYDVSVPNAGAAVSVAFSSPKLGIPETDVLATSVGADHYRVSGLYTPIAGPWQVRVMSTGQPPAAFNLAVSATPPMTAKAPPPPIQTSTWLWGIVEVVAVATALGGARLASTRLTRRRARQLAPSAV